MSGRWLSLLLFLLLAGSASAEVAVWSFDITEDQVGNNPGPPGDGSTDSPATGEGLLSYDDETDVLTYSISWSGLLGDLTALHIHGPATAGQSTPAHLVELLNTPGDVTAAGLDPRDDVLEGEIEEFDDGLDCDQDGALACFLEERAYVNVHSEAFPMGEIRGNLLVPEPGAGACGLAVLGALQAIGLRRRSRRPGCR